MFGGRSPFAEDHKTNLYRLSPEAMLSMSVSTAVLGCAQHAFEAFVERTRERKVILTGAAKAEHAPTQIRAAEAEGEIRAAHWLQQEVYDAFDRLMESGERFDRAHTTWARWRVSHAAELCRRAVNRLWSGSGAHGVYRGSELQRAFRNVQVGAQHASLDFDNGAEAYGRALLQPRKGGAS
jgi:3-hydroxy-9,10-secoandrosta-1,3,5(10)-triene-9,17-dione monooxygenase